MLCVPILFLLTFPIFRSELTIKTKLRNIFVFWAIVIFVLIFFYAFLLIGPGRTTFLSQMKSLGSSNLETSLKGFFLNPNFNFLKRTLLNFSSLELNYLRITYSTLGLTLSVLGLIPLGKKNVRILIFCMLWMVIPLFILSNVSITAPRYLTVITPVFLIPQSYLLLRIFKKGRLYRFIVVSYLLVVISVLSMSIIPGLKFRNKYALLPDYVKWVNKNTEENAFIITTDDACFYRHYGIREIVCKPCRNPSLHLEKFKEIIDKKLEDGVPVYITGNGLYAYNPNNVFSDFIKRNYSLEYIGKEYYEDYYRGFLKQVVLLNPLYKLGKKL